MDNKIDSFAIVDINVDDIVKMDGKDKSDDDTHKRKAPFTTVIQIRKFLCLLFYKEQKKKRCTVIINITYVHFT